MDEASAIGLADGRVNLRPYSTEWPVLFMREKARLEDAIGRHVRDIQHVGSTSIPDMPAKPIIDIGVAVDNFEAAAVCIAPMEALGYKYKGENGIPRRHFFHRGRPRAYHLHMNEVSSKDWRQQIAFRDYLIAHPEAAAAYAALKRELAARYPNDREAYLAGKAPLIEEILRLAQAEQDQHGT